MTSQDRDYEDILRRALHAAAESIEPAGDGLERIRHRLHSPRSAASVLSGLSGLIGWCRLHGIRFFVRLEPATEAGRSGLGQMRQRLAGLGPLSGPLLALLGLGRRASSKPGHRQAVHAQRGADRQRVRSKTAVGHLGPAAAWLRPVLAVSAVVGVVVVGVFALNRAQQTIITPTNSVTSPGGSHHHTASTAPSADASPGFWHPPIGVQSTQQVTAKSRKKGVTSVLPAVACTPTPTPSASTASPSASATPTPTDTVTPTPTDTATPTPTPTDTTVPTPTPTDTSSTGTGTATATATAAAMVAPEAAGAPVIVRCGSSGVATPKASGT